MIHNYYSLIIWIYLILSNIFDMIPFWFWHPQSSRGAIGISFPFPARLECTNLSYMMRVAITMPGRGQEIVVRTNPKSVFLQDIYSRAASPWIKGMCFFPLMLATTEAYSGCHWSGDSWTARELEWRCQVLDVPWCVWMQPWSLHDSIPCCTQIPVSPIAVPKGKKIEAATVHPLESSMA